MFKKSFVLATALMTIIGLWAFRNHSDAPVEAISAIDDAIGGAGNPEELGKVNWSRSLDSALVHSAASDKPVLILFQEVPGCANCTRFGNSTLSHPLIVEAMEDLFEPVCIYNNKKGKDGETLARFKEPAWNNPVVRIVDAKGKDLTPRMPDFRSQWEIVHGMITALEKSGKTAPQYLQLLAEEFQSRESGLDTATFSMYCFWTGEGTYGAIPGVIETAPGFQNGKEVVKVIYDPEKVKKSTLEAQNQLQDFGTCSKNTGFRADREPKYYLGQSKWKNVWMTSLQACRANSMVGKGSSPENILSPRQKSSVR